MKFFFNILFTFTTALFLHSQTKNGTLTIPGDFNFISVYSGIEVNLIRGDENKIVLIEEKGDDTSTV